MHVQPAWLAALAAFGAAAASSAELTDLPPASGAGIERGVALLRCTDPESEILRHSRATVLDVGLAARADVLLTTAHGLPSSPDEIERDCRVLVRGKEYAIDAVWHAGGHASGPEHDWTVLLLGERIKGDLFRWRAAEIAESWLGELVAGSARVRFVLRYADAAQTDCRLESWTSHRLLVHSCVTYPGTSGSPLAVGVDHAPVLIAIHVGSELRFDGTRFDMVSVARPLDAAVLAAIEAAATGATQATDKRRRR
jgi:hypothetical protein